MTVMLKTVKDENLSGEPEMIKAFRDTWELGIHSYLTYLRDRFINCQRTINRKRLLFCSNK
jgi:adenine-specific DNA-methyltransferase